MNWVGLDIVNVVAYCGAVLAAFLLGAGVESWVGGKKLSTPKVLAVAAILVIGIFAWIGISVSNEQNSIEEVYTSSARCLSQNGIYDARADACWREGEKI